jgi:hypothetical protein
MNPFAAANHLRGRDGCYLAALYALRWTATFLAAAAFAARATAMLRYDYSLRRDPQLDALPSNPTDTVDNSLGCSPNQLLTKQHLTELPVMAAHSCDTTRWGSPGSHGSTGDSMMANKAVHRPRNATDHRQRCGIEGRS